MSESGETPSVPAGRAEIIRRSLEAMDDDNIRQIRNVYRLGAVSPEHDLTTTAEEPPLPAESPQAPTEPTA